MCVASISQLQLDASGAGYERRGKRSRHKFGAAQLRYIFEMSRKIVASASRTPWAESTASTFRFNSLSALPIPSSDLSNFCALGSIGPAKNGVSFTIADVGRKSHLK